MNFQLSRRNAEFYPGRIEKRFGIGGFENRKDMEQKPRRHCIEFRTWDLNCRLWIQNWEIEQR